MRVLSWLGAVMTVVRVLMRGCGKIHLVSTLPSEGLLASQPLICDHYLAAMLW